MKIYKATLGRMFNRDYKKTITFKASSPHEAISILVHRAHKGILPKDTSLKYIREVK